MFTILGNCVTVARQTLTLFVGVRIPIPQPVESLDTQTRVEALIFYSFFSRVEAVSNLNSRPN